MSNEEPKIIVDEGWKEKAQAEKEALTKEQTLETAPAAPSTASKAQQPAASTEPPPARGPLPPANFTTLVTTLATQAMVSLGQISNPMTGQAETDLPYAKHFIDTLQVLDEKTRGNLSADESGMLSSLLHEMRMAYVAVRNQSQKK